MLSNGRDELRKKTINGVFWNAVDSIGTQAIGFVVSIVLARLLTPSAYGIIGILTAFISISQLFVDAGLSTALIRKKGATEEDWATVFWFNIVISILCYILLYIIASYVARFYGIADLTLILRVFGLTVVINSLYSTQVAKLTAQINFRTQAKVVLSKGILSGTIGISLAYLGFGVWALVWQQVSAAVFAMLLFWMVSRWHPKFIFSFNRFRSLFGFGSKLLLSNLLNVIYTNISPLIIGKKFSTEDLGFYSRADGLVALPAGVMDRTLSRVVFPVLSAIQNDDNRLRSVYSRYLRLMTSIVAPLLMFLAAVANPLIKLLIGDKWLPCVPYLQILAIGWIVDPMIQVNNNVLYVKGRSDIVLKLEFIKKIIAVTIIICSIQMGVIWLCVGRAVYGYVALFMNMLFCRKFIGMGCLVQLKLVLPIYVASLLAASCAGGIVMINATTTQHFSESTIGLIGLMIIALGVGSLVYIMLAIAMKFDLVGEVLVLLQRNNNREETKIENGQLQVNE